MKFAGGTAPMRQLAQRVRTLRHRTGLSTVAVAEHLGTSDSTLNRIENAHQRLDINWLREMLNLYGVPSRDWEPYLELCRQSKIPGWWRDYGLGNRGYVALEAGAREVREFSLTAVPGLLQTSDYARALFESAAIPLSEEDRERQIEVRMIRQKRLYSEDDPLKLVALVDESVLRRPVGGAKVLRGQLEHLVMVAEADTVVLRVLPTSLGAHAGLDSGSFTMLGFPDLADPDLIYIEHVGGAIHIERPAQIFQGRVTFDQLRPAALSPADSVSLIEELIEQL